MAPLTNRDTFSGELQQSDIDLLRAGLLFSREIAYPNLDVAAYERELDEIAARASQALVTASTPAKSSSPPLALAQFLFDEIGFQGNRTAYDDPRNSYLNDVLQRRLGIPISLSVIYIAVARRLGIAAYGVGLPGHFVVGASNGVDEILLDPFHGGRRLTLADCERLVRETTGHEGALQPSWLRPAPKRSILARMLNNLRMIYVQREQWDEALAVIEHLRQVQPDAPEHLRDLGLIHYQRGQFYPAAHYLESYLEAAPETPEAAAIRQNLTTAFGRWARLN